MKPDRPRSLEIHTPRQSGVRLDFVWESDRWAQHVYWIAPGRPPQRVLASLEGDEANHWPPSPAFQELVIESKADSACSVAMLLGRAGTSHWSASIEADNARVQIRWDVACRLSHPPQFLGSTYHVTDSCERSSRDDALILACAERERLILGEASGRPGGLRLDGGRCLLSPLPQDPPATLRWKYFLAVESSD